jgi:hypothetical protein
MIVVIGIFDMIVREHDCIIQRPGVCVVKIVQIEFEKMGAGTAWVVWKNQEGTSYVLKNNKMIATD